MRITSHSSAMVFGNNYKPKNAEQAQEDLPEMKRQLAKEEESLLSILKQLEGFGDSHKLITKTSGLGTHLDTKA